MGAKAEGLDDLNVLLESGDIPADADVTEIAALLAGQSSSAKAPAEDGEEEEAAANAAAGGDDSAKEKGDKAAAADDKSGADDKTGTDSTDAKQSGDTSSDTAQDDQSTGPIANKSGTGTIPFGVLQGTRERLAQAEENLRKSHEERQAALQRAEQAERQIAELRAGSKPSQVKQATQQVQDIADQAGITDAQGRPIDVTRIDVESLRGEFPQPIVDMLGTFQKAMQAQQATIDQLRQRDQQRVAKESLTEEEQIQADIDAVPRLALWAADKDPAMFNRAVALDNALLAEAKWAGATRLERYQEIARILGGEDEPAPESKQNNASTTTAKNNAPAPAQVKQKVSAALQKAAARAAPISHSDLPAGAPAAQSEVESVESMDVLDLAAKMESMTPQQQADFLSKFA